VVRPAVADAVPAEVGVTPADLVTVPFGRRPKIISGELRRAEARRRYLSGELTARRFDELALQRSPQ
jgi:hypothetical protein